MRHLFILLCFVLLATPSLPAHTEGDRAFPVSVSVYPNPSTTGAFALEMRDAVPGTLVTIKVYNLIGNEVFSRQVVVRTGVHKEVISLQDAPKGVYMLELIQGQEKISRRLSYV
ncbi:MAG: T9SS C-terminal target domain-containing protein [Bacteroidetes bacterium]|nr:MAG: T9SS C-terminal target domain-containing protein [Bacteroidota bacterium]